MTSLKSKLVLGLLAAAVLFYVLALRAENTRLAAEAAQNAAAASALGRELALGLEALRLRETERQALALENQKLKNDLRGLYENDADAKAWGADCLPGAVCDRVRQSLSPGP